MSDVHRPEPPSPVPKPPLSPATTSTIPLKRKDPPDEQKPFSPTLPAGVTDTHQGEYEKGRITCEVCGTGVSFRDEETGGFTLKHWEAHRLTCSPPSTNEPVIYTPESTAEALAHPPTKRRRAKRTEEERIDYLRADPYVAQFEAYRVLCASCDKWIRLRPNSTYCSIPWDAHRKSCLAKKVNSKNVYALEERNALFSKDPDVRKFDAERVLCSLCDKWLSVNPDDHLQAVQKWLQHRAACQKTSTPSTLPGNRQSLPDLPVSAAPPPTEQQLALAGGGPPPGPPGPGPSNHRIPPRSASSISPKPGPSFSHPPNPPAPPTPAPAPSRHSNHNHNHNHSHSQSHTSHTSHHSHSHSHSQSSNTDPSFHDFNPSNFAPTHESRRRNAEQRAATLRADTLISEVEPNRVFCSLCQKWVQLRQDSSYCAYPWQQHRGKCLARHQRRVQKTTDVGGGADPTRGRKHLSGAPEEEDELMTDNDPGLSDGPESEEAIDSHAEEERFRRKEGERRRVAEHRHSKDLQRGNGKARARSAYHYPNQTRHSLAAVSSTSTSSAYRHETRSGHPYYSSSRTTTTRPWDEDLVDADVDAEIDGDTYMDDDRHMSRPVHRAQVRRPWPVGLADLDSPPGRRDFVLASIDYLFRTTYESTDDMTISALLVYLNAAMPQDKHEDFDTAEVTKTAAVLHEKARIIFEGDLIRLPD